MVFPRLVALLGNRVSVSITFRFCRQWMLLTIALASMLKCTVGSASDSSSEIAPLLSFPEGTDLAVISASQFSILSTNVTMYPTPANSANSTVSWLSVAADAAGKNVATLAAWEDEDSHGYMINLLTSNDFGASWKLAYQTTAYSLDNAAYVVSDSEGCKIFVSLYGANNFGTMDCGQSWWQASSSSELTFVSASNTNLLLVGVKDNRLVMSQNYGYTWSYIWGTQASVDSVAVSSNGTFVAAAGCYNNGNQICIQTSHNITSWTFRVLTLGWGEYCDLNGAIITSDESGELLYIAAAALVYKSSNFGQSWAAVTTVPSSYPDYSWTSILCDSTCQRIVLTGRKSGQDADVLFISNDNGNKWKNQAFMGDYTANVDSFAVAMSQDGSFIAIATAGNANTDSDFIGGVFTNCNSALARNITIASQQPTAAFAFSGLGYVCGSLYATLYLRIPCTEVTEEAALVTMKAVTNLDDVVLFSGKCSISTLNLTSCAVNIELNNSIISDTNDGSLSILVTVQPWTSPMCEPTVNYIYEGEIILAVLPVSIPLDIVAAPGFSYDVYSIIAVGVTTLAFALYGVYAAGKIAPSSKASHIGPIVRFLILGFLFSTEVWLFCVLRADNTDKVGGLRELSVLLVTLRLAALVPGFVILYKLFAPAEFSGTRFYSESMDQSSVREQPAFIASLSVVLLLDPQLVVYYPWRLNSLTSSPAAEDSNQDDDEAATTSLLADGSTYCRGYPDVVMMELCTMFSGLTLSISLLAQIIILSIYFPSASGQDSNNYKGASLLLRAMFISYSVVLLVSSMPTYLALWRHLLKSLSCSKRRFTCWCPSVGGLYRYILSYDASIRIARLAALRAIPFRVCWAISKFWIIFGLYVKLGRRSCRDDVSCWLALPSTMFIAVCLYFSMLAIELFVIVEYDDDYDAHTDVLRIAASYSLDAAKITRLLQATPVMLAVLRGGALFLMFLYVFGSLAPLNSGYDFHFFNASERVVAWIVLLMEFLYPWLAWALYKYGESGGNISDAVMALFRIDIYVINMFLLFMLACLAPLSILSNISIMKANYEVKKSNSVEAPVTNGSSVPIANIVANKDSTADSSLRSAIPSRSNNLLSFKLRDNWDEVDSGLDTSTMGSSNSARSPLRTAYIFIDRLSKRFTVVYSFIKLCGTIAFTLSMDQSYLQCGVVSHYGEKTTCDIDYYWKSGPDYLGASHSNACLASCVSSNYPPRISYPVTDGFSPPLPPTPWQCTAEISGACICGNWFTFQFTVIVLHVIHYLVQCYFYIRYNYFDPQQNQINCVETYTFAGNNLTLFLTQPSMCFLSIIEAFCITIVWVEVLFAPGVYCKNSYHVNFSLYFAIFITVIEVYKANLSTFTKLASRREYWWALWSLVRLDLFAFYGLTLFLQSFFFPFSCVGYCFSGYSKTKAGDNDDDALKTSLLVVATAEFSPETNVNRSNHVNEASPS